MAAFHKHSSAPAQRFKKRRTFNGRVFRSRRAYSFVEIAALLNTHVRTVQIWRREGLKILDDTTKPFLVMGHDIREFLNERVRNRKKPLSPGQFFCTRCREPRQSQPDQLSVDHTDRWLGPTYRQVLIRGVCETCGQSLLLFSSDKKLAEWLKTGVRLSKRQKGLVGSAGSSINTDMLRNRENVQSKREE